jgi:formyl-CoA transferase
MARFGIAYDDVRTVNPGVVYCSITGFGAGAGAGLPGYDFLVQAVGGLMSITGAADGPPYRLGVAIADIVTGMFAAQGISFALLARERTGRGQFVDIAMLDSVAALLSYQAAIYFATGSAPARMGNRHPTIVPYETFAASDGDFVLAVGNDEQWRRFCGAAGLEADERYATNRQRVTLYAEVKAAIAARLREHSRAHWIERLTAAGVPCGSVRDLHEVFTDPQLAAREMIATIDHARIGALRLLGGPVKLSDTPARAPAAPPTLGEHTDAVLLQECGMTREAVAGLRARGIV